MKLALRHRPTDGLTDEQLRAFRRWTLAAGVENLLIFSPLAPPRLYERFYGSNNRLNRLLRLGGTDAVPPEEGINKLFVNLNGVLGSAMGAALIYSAADPRNRWGIPLVSGIARLIAVALIWYYAKTENINRVMLLFSVPDLVFSSAFIYYASKSRGASPRK
jgi:hypothetical protein